MDVLEGSLSSSLQGKVAVITGAASGIALATARLFHSEGARLVLGDISDEVHRVAEGLGDRAKALTTDVTRADQVKALIDLAVTEFGRIDILCNVAGASGQMVRLVDQTEDDYDMVLNINLRSVFLGMKYAIPHMIEQGGGAIVNVASTAALKGLAERATYGAAKAGVLQMTKVAAVEYATSGVRANAVCPGVIKTPMYDIGMERNPEYVARVQSLVPMLRPGQPEEVAEAMLFLASDKSSYITGMVMPVEGGQTI
jgi:NAD(P)-dependent dehydrogenase (short-subunit alcohol dehydrogenase family)